LEIIKSSADQHELNGDTPLLCGKCFLWNVPIYSGHTAAPWEMLAAECPHLSGHTTATREMLLCGPY
jgi:hypothetical protein